MVSNVKGVLTLFGSAAILGGFIALGQSPYAIKDGTILITAGVILIGIVVWWDYLTYGS